MLKKSASRNSSASSLSKNNKRYLILTYVVEFDRVHYPLPLKFEDKPNYAALQSTITRLRVDLKIARQSAGNGKGHEKELARLTDENRQLREAVDRAADAEERAGQLEQQVAELKQALKAKQDREKSVLDGEVAGAEQVRLLETEVDELREKLEASQTQKLKVVSKHRKDQRVLVEELEKRAESERTYRLQCRKLKTELEKMTQQQQKEKEKEKEKEKVQRRSVGRSRDKWAQPGRDARTKRSTSSGASSREPPKTRSRSR
jgi:coiled-coil domain-containing protein 61